MRFPTSYSIHLSTLKQNKGRQQCGKQVLPTGPVTPVFVEVPTESQTCFVRALCIARKGGASTKALGYGEKYTAILHSIKIYRNQVAFI